ncbi:hypothetical protein AB1Y20_009989 [Prymnesium parvum]|uniref:Cyclin-F n=1 Tax=Prymnesium parvum TaxID=97485 RepID=A0AB34K345_PRYPA
MDASSSTPPARRTPSAGSYPGCRRSKRWARTPGKSSKDSPSLGCLPDECLVEVFLLLSLNELLDCAWVCKRWYRAVQDESLWKFTRFSSCNSHLLLRHFKPDWMSCTRDHTGMWMKCKRIAGLVPLMCRSVELDYVDRGEGVCYRLLRSVSCLQQLRHENILPLEIVNLDRESNRLVLFYADSGVSLETLLANGKLPLYQAKDILRQLLRALAHCHGQGICHRNLKPKYVLLRKSARGTDEAPLYDARLSDFNSMRWLGVLRLVGQEPLYGTKHISGACSPTVVTQPYRAPEILLGCTTYSTAIDIWALACVFLEMCSGSIMFVGDSDIGQLFKIFEVLGTPGPGKHAEWDGVDQLGHFNHLFPNMRPKDLRTLPATAELCQCPIAEDFLHRILTLDPLKRISAVEALRHPFIAELALSPSPPKQHRAVPLLSPPSISSVRSSLSMEADGGSFDLFSVWEVWKGIELETRRAMARAGSRRGGATGVAYVGRVARRADARAGVVWMLRASNEFCKCDGTVHLAVAILDHFEAHHTEDLPRRRVAYVYQRIMSHRVIGQPGQMSWGNLFAISALLIACKFQEVEIHMLTEFLQYCNEGIESADVLQAELVVCSALQMDFSIPCTVDFLYCALQRLRWPSMFSVHRGQHDQVTMLAQFLCELSLLSHDCAQQPASLVASAALCLALACLRCGLWRDSTPGPSACATSYWTASMAQVTGYSRSQLAKVLPHLQREHEEAFAKVGEGPTLPVGHPLDLLEFMPPPWKYDALVLKFSRPRFLGALKVPPFAPHAGGALLTPTQRRSNGSAMATTPDSHASHFLQSLNDE